MTHEPLQAAPSAALTPADLSFLRILGERESAPPPGTGTGAGRQADFHARYREPLRTAAFLGEFDPAALMPGIGEADLKLLLRDCTVSTNGIVSRWRLTAVARGRLLEELARDDAMDAHIAAARRYLERTGEPSAPFSEALVALCRGDIPDRHRLVAAGLETWSAYRAALAALKGSGIPAAHVADRVLADVSHAEMLEPFRFLTGWKPVAPPPGHDPHQVFGEDAFVGRRDELQRLRSFVDVLESQSYYESISRGVNRRLRAERPRTMILSGVGGVGKSTLVAKFILDHVAHVPGLVRFAYLDFDRSTVNTTQPATLVLDIARQLRWQIPEFAARLDSLRERLRAEMRSRAADLDPVSTIVHGDEPGGAPGDAELPPELVSPGVRNQYVKEMYELLRRSARTYKAENPTLLLVLDTFEEVQTLGDEAVRRVERLVDELQSFLGSSGPALIVGRDAVTGFFDGAERVELAEFGDQPSRRAFLEARGVPAEQSARVARVAGGRPLALLLAARLVKEQGIGAIELSVVQRMGSLFRERLIEGVLYERILDHISDPDLRKIAHPGLVLRWIDADVIAAVIVPVLGLRGFTAAKIQKVMDALRRQKDLVRVEPDGSVVHRSDVRAQMLELMTAAQAVMVENLHRAAVDYYVARQRDPGSAEQEQRWRIEELYHRLCLGTDLDMVVIRWIAPARSALARALGEIADPRGRTALRILLGRLPTFEEARDLPARLASEFTVRTVKSAIAYHMPEKALEALRRAPPSLPVGFIELYTPLAYDRAGAWDAAADGYQKLALDTSRPEHVLAAADFFERRFPHQYHSSGSMGRLWEALSSLSPRTADIELAQARLRRRDSGGRWQAAAADLPLCAGLLPVTGAATPRTQWLVTLTTDVESRGLALFDGMTVTDAMRRQLAFLISLFEESGNRMPRSELLPFAQALVESRNVGVRSGASQAGFVYADIWPVMRHIMRPSTPQWYVPFAAVLRDIVGGDVDTGNLFGRTGLPRLPEPLPARVTTTRSLAELFAQLDQLGLLQGVLRRMSAEWPSLRDGRFEQLLRAYLAWRADIFPTLDEWMEELFARR